MLRTCVCLSAVPPVRDYTSECSSGRTPKERESGEKLPEVQRPDLRRHKLFAVCSSPEDPVQSEVLNRTT